MNTKKILLGTLAGTVTFFLLAGLVYGLLLQDFMNANSNQCAMKPMEEMSMGVMVVSNLVLCLLVALIFDWSGTKGWMNGLSRGAVIGGLISLSFDLSYYSMSTMFLNIAALFVDVVTFTVLVGLTGMVIGMVMGSGKKDSTAA